MHAALADPARLRITDALCDGDASPKQLGAMLTMPSNLLAHHLRVLEQAGIITRRRSEGDHRRSYLRLIPGTLESLTGRPRRTAPRVLFVCTANSARSHLAAALWRQASHVPAASQAPTRRPRSTRAPSPSPPPPGTSCRCPAAAPPHRRGPARRGPCRHGLRPGLRRTRRPGGRALVGPRPGPGGRPRQLRRRASRTRPSRGTLRAASGGLLALGSACPALLAPGT